MEYVNRLSQPLELGVLGQLFGHFFRVVVGRPQRAFLQVGQAAARRLLRRFN